MSLEARLRARLHARPPAVAAMRAQGRPAATLTLITYAPPRPPRALFILRAARLRRHAGEIAFPGGGLERDDAGFGACALRETHEELGVNPADVRLIGWLDPQVSRAGYAIAPAVGLAAPEACANLRLDPTEVADAFFVPLDFLMNPQNHRVHGERRNGRHVSWDAMPWRGRYVWGVTASIVKNMYRRVFDDADDAR